ncbi:hypothetical protein ABPG75_012124 [Micractinium tetrahymenae]
MDNPTLLQALQRHLGQLLEGQPRPAGLAWCCAAGAAPPELAEAVAACWRAAAVHRSGTSAPRLLVSHPDAAALASLSERLSASGTAHVAVQAVAHNPAALVQAARVAGVENLREFVFLTSLGDACRDAGNVTSLHAWAALASMHGIVTLDLFAARHTKHSSSGSESSDSGDASNRDSLGSSGSGSSGGTAGSSSSSSSSSSSASQAAAAQQPMQLQPLVRLPSKRRMYRQLSMVTELAEEEDEKEGGEADVASELEYLRALAAMPEEELDGAGDDKLGAIAEEPSAEGEEEERDAPAAAATAAGARPRASLLRTAPRLLTAAAAAGLVPRPGSGCHLSCEDGSALLLLHLDTIPFSIRKGHAFDAEHLYWLQLYALGGGLQRSALSMQQIQECLSPDDDDQQQPKPAGEHGPLCFVAEIGGCPAAVLMLQPQQARQATPPWPGRAQQAQRAPTPPPQDLSLLMAAMFPEMDRDQCAGLFMALASYTLQQLLAAGRPAAVRQGNLLLQQLARAGSGAGLSRMGSASLADMLLLRVVSAPAGSASGGADTAAARWQQHSLEFASGHSLDSMAVAVAAHMQELATEPGSAPGSRPGSRRASRAASRGGSRPGTAAEPAAAAPGGLSTASSAESGSLLSQQSVDTVVKAARRLSALWQRPVEGPLLGPASVGPEEMAAEELLVDAAGVVTGYMEAARFDTSSFTPATPLMDAGLDSLDMLKLASMVSEALGVVLPSTVLFDYPSIEALCGYILATQVPTTSSRRASQLELPVMAVAVPSLAAAAAAAAASRRASTVAGRRGTISGYRRSGGGLRRSTLQSMFAHGALASIPLDGRRATIAPLSGIPGAAPASSGLTTLQVVVAEAAAMRLPGSASAAHCCTSFCSDMISPVPAARWSWEQAAAAATARLPARFGGFLPDVAGFDSGLFSVSPSECQLMDPQQRLLLEAAWEAAAATGSTSGTSLLARPKPGLRRGLPGSGPGAGETGVFVGASYAEWMLLQQQLGAAATSYTASGSGLSVLAGRISYTFGWTGPATVVDTACSSSLVALSATHQSLMLGVTRTAVACGINLQLHAGTTEAYNAAGTSLGDPIEVGAALAVLMDKRSASDGPLALAASKAAAGHAEAGAGLLGMAAALLAVEERALPRLLHLSSMNLHCQACITTSCKGGTAASAPRAAAPLPVAGAHGRATACVSAFAFQGTNAHAALEILDSEDLRSMFGRGRRRTHAWRRTPFWLLPPASALLRGCSVRAAGAGAARQVLMHGQLRSAGLAELLLGAGGAGGGGAWALALEAAYAAATALSAVHDGRQQPQLGLAQAVVGSAASVAAAAELLAAVDARSGSIVVSVGACQLLSSQVATAAELQPAEQPAQHQQHRQRQQALLGMKNWLSSSPAAAHAAIASVAAEAAQAAQQQRDLFLQPALLQASMQLRQLPLATDDDACTSDAQQGQPAAFGLLLPGMCKEAGGSYRSSRSASRQSSRRWQASACARALRLSSDGTGCSTMCLQGLQLQPLVCKPRQAAATMAAAPSACRQVCYTTAWQAARPADAVQMRTSAGGLRRRLGRAHAVLSMGGSARRYGRSQAARQAVSCRLPGPSGSSVDAGQAACLQASQLLQICAAHGGGDVSLTTLSAPAAATVSPAAGSRWGSRAASAALHAVLRCVAGEQPGAAFTAGSLCEVGCPAGSGDTERAAGLCLPAWDAEFGCHGQQLLAGTHLAARLLPAAAPSKQDSGPCLAAGLQWAVSGGTGSLGLLTAGWLQQQQTALPLLLGRSGRLADAAPPVLLQAARCSLVLCMCDAGMQADAAAVAALAAAPLAGFLHAGGILRDAAVQQQTAASIRAVHAPKSAGLHCLLAQAALAVPLQHCLLISSIAAVTGPAGSSSYAAANAALDAAAERLQLQGLAGSSVQWGAWAGIGMVADNAAVHRAMQRSGVGMLQPPQGLAAMQQLVTAAAAASAAALAVIPFDWRRFMQQPARAAAFFYGEHRQAPAAQAASDGTSLPLLLAASATVATTPGWHHTMPPLSAADPAPAPASLPSQEEVLQLVLQTLEEVHGCAMGPQQPLVQAGLDSLGAVELRTELQQRLGLALPSTLAFDYPTAAAVAAHCHSLMSAVAGPAAAAAAAKAAHSKEEVAAALAAALHAVAGSADLAPDAPLLSAGLDSLSAVELRDDLQRRLGLALPSTLVFDYPTPAALQAFLLEHLAAAAAAGGSVGHSTSHAGSSLAPFLPGQLVQAPGAQKQPLIAVDASTSRLSAPSISSSADSCRVTPFCRWGVDSRAPGVSHRPGGRFGRFLGGVEGFDAGAFSISPSEALLVDPQQRMMLEDAREVLAAWPSGADSEGAAVLACQSFWDYAQQTDRALPGVGEAYKATGRCFSVAAGRISFCYGLKGPAISLDTACSSSLSGSLLLRRMLLEGRCRRGLVTSALLTLDPATISMLTAASMLAPDGRCKTLDAAADGYVRGEACVTLGMSARPALDLADSGLPPAAVVLGGAINQDGRSSGLTAPNGPSQQQVIRLALGDAQLGPADVSSLEMHGTGTSLGDPIEVGAILAVFGSSSPALAAGRRQVLMLSAAKSSVGHAEPAAGAVGMLRSMHRLHSSATVGIMHLTAVNLHVASSLEHQGGGPAMWLPRCESGAPGSVGAGGSVGMSGFAFQGTNAHLIMSRPVGTRGCVQNSCGQ